MMNKFERILVGIGIVLFLLILAQLVVYAYYTYDLMRAKAETESRLQEINTKILGLDNTLQTLQTQSNTQLRELQKQAESIKNLQEAIKVPSYLMRRTGLPLDAVTTLIKESKEKNIPLDMWLGLIDYECKFDPSEKNPVSTATGLGQFLHSTGRWVARERGVSFSPEMLEDPVYSIKHMAWYLDYLYKQHGSWDKALFGYGDQTSSYTRIVTSRGKLYRKELDKLKEGKK